LTVEAGAYLLVVGTTNTEGTLTTGVLVGTSVRVSIPVTSVGTSAATEEIVVDEEGSRLGLLLLVRDEKRVFAVGRGGHIGSESYTTATRVDKDQSDVASIVAKRISGLDYVSFGNN
jgi:hypothetical protein